MYFSLLQLLVFLFNVLRVAVSVIRDRFVSGRLKRIYSGTM